MKQRLLRAIKNPKKTVTLLTHELRKLTGHRDYIPFIVLTRSRTGSNLLISFLDSHPNVHARGEIFTLLGNRDYQRVLNSIFGKNPRNVKAVGFKLFYYHPRDNSCPELWNTLVQMPELHVIHLKRQNILRTLLSRRIALKQDLWEIKQPGQNGTISDRQVSFTRSELLEGFQKTRLWEQKYSKKFAEHPILEVNYENLIENPEKEFHLITRFLKLNSHIPHTCHQQQNPEKTSDLILNYKELREVFSGSEWASFFES